MYLRLPLKLLGRCLLRPFHRRSAPRRRVLVAGSLEERSKRGTPWLLCAVATPLDFSYFTRLCLFSYAIVSGGHDCIVVNNRFRYTTKQACGHGKEVVLPDCVVNPRIPHRGDEKSERHSQPQFNYKLPNIFSGFGLKKTTLVRQRKEQKTGRVCISPCSYVLDTMTHARLSSFLKRGTSPFLQGFPLNFIDGANPPDNTLFDLVVRFDSVAHS